LGDSERSVVEAPAHAFVAKRKPAPHRSNALGCGSSEVTCGTIGGGVEVPGKWLVLRFIP
jgi:hypothetical protein